MLVVQIVLLQNCDCLLLVMDSVHERRTDLLNKLTRLSHEVKPEEVKIWNSCLLVRILIEYRLESF